MNDTIAAIATAPGAGAVAIVRVSGPCSGRISRAVFRPAGGKWPKTRYLCYGHALDAAGEVIDEVMMVLFRAPRSYTREDGFEIQCHGGSAAAQMVLAAVLAAGARLAEPGEFTRRAFLNGRIDLAQAEAVMRLISARSEKAARLSRAQLSGALSQQVAQMQNVLLDLLAAIEAVLDYPEEDLEEQTGRAVLEKSQALSQQLASLLAGAQYARRVQEGVRVCIAGRPNAGKSSLLNALIGQARAIVTDEAGTTRDVLSEQMTIGGAPLTLIDTAGLRAGGGKVERIGIERAHQEIDACDVLLLVWDMTAPLDVQDEALLQLDKPVVLVKNKADLTQADLPVQTPPNVQTVTVSALTGQGMDALKDLLVGLVAGQDAQQSVYLTEQRHVQACRVALESLQTAMDGLEKGLPLDLPAMDLRQAWKELGAITGQGADDELISRIFENFCLGK